MGVNRLSALKHLPGDEGLPFFGHLFEFMADATGFYNRRRAKYGDIYKVHTLFGSSIVLAGPTANRFILIEQAKKTTNKEAWEMALSDLFPNGLMLMDGDRHKYHRNIMNQAFRKGPMQGYLDVMPSIIADTLSELEGKRRVLLFPFMKRLTLRLAARVFFGIEKRDEISQLYNSISDVVNAALALPINFPGTKYRKGVKGRAALVTYFNSIIAERRAHPGKDLFSRLCQAKSEEGDQFTDQEIIDHMIFVLMASHDTTAITLTLMSYHLAKYPAWQEKVRAEIEEHGKRSASMENLRHFENTSLVMKETLRLHPPLVTIVRKLEENIEVDGADIPKNTVVNVVLQSTHLDDRVWDRPGQFEPERFVAPRKEHSKCPYSYAPFGAGQHHCIGFSFAENQIKLVMIELISRFHLSVPEDYECPIGDVPLKHPKDQLPIYLNRIKI